MYIYIYIYMNIETNYLDHTSQPANQPANQPTSQPASQPTSQPTSHPATHHPSPQPQSHAGGGECFLWSKLAKNRGGHACHPIDKKPRVLSLFLCARKRRKNVWKMQKMTKHDVLPRPNALGIWPSGVFRGKTHCFWHTLQKVVHLPGKFVIAIAFVCIFTWCLMFL